MLAFSNYDQALSLALAPSAWAAFARLGARPGRLVVAGLFAAAPAYAYPEMAPAFAGGYLLMLPVWIGSGRGAGPRRRRGALALGCALLLLAPFVETTTRLLSWQLGSLEGPRPGGLRFEGLLSVPRAATGIWGLGSETTPPWAPVPRGAHLAAAAMTAAALLGARDLLRRRSRGRAVLGLALLHLAGVAVLLLCFQYHYGAYKLLSLGSWSLTFLVWQGLTMGTRRLPRGARGASLALLVGVLVAQAWTSSGLRWLRSTATPDGLDFHRLRRLERAAQPLRPAGVLIDVESPAAQQWAVYYLRTLPLRLQSFRGYLGQPSSLLWQAQTTRPSWEDVLYLPDDAPPLAAPRARGVQLVAAEPPLRLWRLRRDVALVDLRQGGKRLEPGRRGGPGRLSLHLYLRREGLLRLRAKLSPRPMPVRLSAEALATHAWLPADAIDTVIPLAAGPGLVEFETRERRAPLGLLRWSLELEPDERCPQTESRDAAAPRRPVWYFQDDTGAVALVTSPGERAHDARHVTPKPEPGLRLVGASDLDGDGWLDLAFQDQGGAVRLWMLGPTRARLSEVTLAARPGAPAARLVARHDVDGDGDTDLVWQDHDAREVEYQLGCGPSFFGWARPSPGRPAGPSWRLALVGDLDQDGDTDLLWTHPRARRAALWYLDRKNVGEHAALVDAPGDSGWRPAALLPPAAGAEPPVNVVWQRDDGRVLLQRSTRDGVERGRRWLAAPAPGWLRGVALERAPPEAPASGAPSSS